MSKKNTLKATHQGELDLNNFKISCAVLSDGTRVLVNRSLASALGIKGSGAYWKKKKEGKGALLPEYISAKYLQPFISKNLSTKLLEPIVYTNKQGAESEGIPATLLADICDVYVKADKKGALKNNAHISENAYKIILAFSKVGITALVDEASGYQYDREKDELQKLLKAYVSEELLPWQKRFPDIFYKELFRLNGWDFTVKGIKKRPSVVGTWTSKLIYEQLPPNVLEEIKKKTPKSKKGNYTANFHQSLTTDVGHPNLTAQINQVITLFQLSDNMKEMWAQFEKLNQRKMGQLSLPFDFNKKGQTIEPIEEKELSEFDKNIVKALGFNPKK